ncbi:hypothetical protein EKK58_02295 [Candidatus Dependentiae bacterium]|nr:MAG: hypothetical protein EKK58_02295 [Candidatus Dependentiae bacterium]
MNNNNDLTNLWAAFLLTEKRVSKNTYLAYITDIKQFELYAQRHAVLFLQCTSDQLSKYIDFLYAQQIKATTLARKIIALKLFFGYISKRFLLENCTEYITTPKKEMRLPKYLTEDEVMNLLSYCQKDSTPFGKRNNLMVHLLYATGMRISELAQITIANIRFEDKILSLLGKGNKERMVPLPEQSLELLHDFIKIDLPFFLRKPVSTGREPLFPVLYGKHIKPISRQSLWLILKKLCAQAGIQKNVSPHQLRHSLATHLLKNGADLRSLQLLLGHQNLSSVEIYTHIETSHLRAAYDKKHPRS